MSGFGVVMVRSCLMSVSLRYISYDVFGTAGWLLKSQADLGESLQGWSFTIGFNLFNDLIFISIRNISDKFPSFGWWSKSKGQQNTDEWLKEIQTYENFKRMWMFP